MLIRVHLTKDDEDVIEAPTQKRAAEMYVQDRFDELGCPSEIVVATREEGATFLEWLTWVVAVKCVPVATARVNTTEF